MRTFRNVTRASVCAAILCAALFAHAQTTVAGRIPGQFNVSPNGAASYRIPVQVPPGVAGMAPQLELTYSSQGNNGMLGLGWGLSGLSSISRCPKTRAQDGLIGGVNFDASDRYCLDGQRMVLASGTYGVAGSEYRTEIDAFSKITAVGTAGQGPASFVVKTKAGLTLEYGNTIDSRIEALKATSGTSPWTSGTVRIWAQNKVTDAAGNYMLVSYIKDPNGSYVPSRMDYTGNAASSPVVNPSLSVVFVVSNPSRLDLTTGYQAGATYATAKRLAKIQTFAGASLVKEYRLDYAAQSNAMDRSKLLSIKECSSLGACLPATSVQWGAAQPAGFATASSWIADFGTTASWSNASVAPRLVGDINGDGLPDVIGFGPTGVMVSLNTGSGFATPTRWTDQFSPTQGWANNNAHPRQVVDVNGDGRPDIVGFGPSGVMVALNTGSSFEPSVSWVAAFGVNAGWSDNNLHPRQLVDVDGDGLPDVLGFGPAGVMVSLNTGESFTSPVNKLAQFGVNAGGWSDSNLYPRQLVDVNGDGLPDIVGFSSAGVMVSLNTGGSFSAATSWISQFGTSVGGWSNSSTYPRQVVDVNGDGLPDIVGFFSSGVMVSLNTGTAFAPATTWVAQFGTANGWVDSDTHPRQMVDVNGDGLVDIVGFGPSGVMVSLNTGTFLDVPTQWIAGFGTSASWTNGLTFPRQLVDVNGDGMPDVVGFFSSGVSVAKNQKDPLPNLVVNVANGAGVFNAITYSPLTLGNIYTKDTGGNLASFPRQDVVFPMYVVSETSRSNGVGGSASTTYSYGGLKVEAGTGRGMLGFRWFKAKETQTNLENYTQYRQDYPYVGMPQKSELRLIGGVNGGLLKRTSTEVQCIVPATGAACVIQQRCDLSTNSSACTAATNARYFPYAASTTEESWDINGAPFPATRTSSTYGVNPGDGKFYGDVLQVVAGTNDGSNKATVNQYSNVDTSNWILGRLKKATVTSTTVTIAGDGTSASPYPAPTISASQGPSPWVATQPATLSWTSTNASAVTYQCTSSGSGFTAAETVWPNGTTTSQIASEDWVGTPSSCVFKATGPGGSATYNLTVNTLAAPSFTFNPIISSNTLNYNLRAAAVAAGWDQRVRLKATVTINAGVYVGSSSTATPAFDTGVKFPAKSELTLINNGSILGRGGDGGRGESEDNLHTPGLPGGPALLAQHALRVSNLGVIGGGGGGGGGGAGEWYDTLDEAGGGGGGGRGYSGGAAGTAGMSSNNFPPGPSSAGTPTAAGLGGTTEESGSGGNGGDLGASGSTGGYAVTAVADNLWARYGKPGGAGGAAVINNGYITWTVVGTRLGALQ